MTSFRGYHDLSGADRSGLGSQVADQRQRVADRLADITHVIPVMSGKGGVGKSYVTGLLARGLSDRGFHIGVLDADLRSPTIARMLKARGPLDVTDRGVIPSTGDGGIRVMSTDLLLGEGKPLSWTEPNAERFVWRGVLETGALREFLSDVAWGTLDYLLIDLPPGADGVVDLHQLVPDLTGAVVVTIPSDESYRSVTRTMTSARDDGIAILGVVENMGSYLCADCGSPGALFTGDAGARLSREFETPLIATLPFAAGGPIDAGPLLDRFLETVS